MSSFGASANGVLRGLLFLAILLFLPAWAKADDFGFSGDDSCSDPAIFSETFSITTVNSQGGMCRAFGNHSGVTFGSLAFTTTLPNANPSDAFLCSPGPYFLDCGFSVDGSPRLLPSGSFITSGTTVTVEFFGTDPNHPGIPSVVLDAGDNFFINLNNPVCGTACAQPDNDTSAGDWLTNGTPDTFSAAANGVPEPRSLALLLVGVGGLASALSRRIRGAS